jgi:hypothetical protein
MRAWIGVFSLSAMASTGFAVNELHHLRHHTPMAMVAQPPPPVAVAEPTAPQEEPVPPSLSTWRGPTPFGGVAAAEVAEPPEDEDDVDSDDEGEGIPDEVDRCPDDNSGDDNDGCPDSNVIADGRDDDRRVRIVIRHEPEVVITLDNDEDSTRRIIRLEELVF